MIVSTIFAFIVGVAAYLIGSFGHLFFDSLAEVGGSADNIVPYMLNEVIPQGFQGLIAVLVLSASMSTLASVSLAASSVLSVDFYKGTLNKDASDKSVTLIMRLFCGVFVAISVAVALLNNFYNIAAIAYLMGLSWGTLSGCFFGPFVLGMYNKKITKTAAISSVIGGIVLTLILIFVFGAIGVSQAGGEATFGNIFKSGVSFSPLIGVICMIASCIIVIVVSLFTKPLDKEIVDAAFEPKETDI